MKFLFIQRASEHPAETYRIYSFSLAYLKKNISKYSLQHTFPVHALHLGVVLLKLLWCAHAMTSVHV